MNKKMGILMILSTLLMVGCGEKESKVKGSEGSKAAVEEVVNVKDTEEVVNQQEESQNEVKTKEVIETESETKGNN